MLHSTTTECCRFTKHQTPLKWTCRRFQICWHHSKHENSDERMSSWLPNIKRVRQTGLSAGLLVPTWPGVYFPSLDWPFLVYMDMYCIYIICCMSACKPVGGLFDHIQWRYREVRVSGWGPDAHTNINTHTHIKGLDKEENAWGNTWHYNKCVSQRGQVVSAHKKGSKNGVGGSRRRLDLEG